MTGILQCMPELSNHCFSEFKGRIYCSQNSPATEMGGAGSQEWGALGGDTCSVAALAPVLGIPISPHAWCLMTMAC